MSYYKRQLNKVVTKSEFPPTFKFQSNENSTNWMDLNTESAEALREWLDENYPRPMIKLEDVPDKKSEL